MEKMFNFISVIVGLVGGFIVSLFGGWDVMLYTILLFAILDYFTGILKAVYKKELSSAIGFKGIVKKIMVFVVIAVAYNVQRMTGDTIPLREIVIVFFICNEALSILENAAEFINIPQQLKDVLLQLRDKNAAKAEEKETKQKIMKINWAKDDETKYKKLIEDNNESLIFVKGDEQYIKKVNNNLKQLKDYKGIEVIDCYNLNDINGEVRNISTKYGSVLKTLGK